MGAASAPGHSVLSSCSESHCQSPSPALNAGTTCFRPGPGEPLTHQTSPATVTTLPGIAVPPGSLVGFYGVAEARI